MHHAYTTEALNKNQYGFTPQKNTVDAAMEERQYIEPHINKEGVAIIISLDVQGAFLVCMVAGDIAETERHKMPQKPILLSKRLPEGEEGGHDREQFQRRESQNPWLSARGVLRARDVEYPIRHGTQSAIQKAHARHSVRRQFADDDTR